MTLEAGLKERLVFLMRVIKKEQNHLAYSQGQLFKSDFNIAKAQELEVNQELSQILEAFNGRFFRLQDMVGDKLLPAWLSAVKDKPSTAIDNLDKAEKLGLLTSSDEWFELRHIRNQMVHEYIEDIEQLVKAVHAANNGIVLINDFAANLIADVEKRFKI